MRDWCPNDDVVRLVVLSKRVPLEGGVSNRGGEEDTQDMSDDQEDVEDEDDYEDDQEEE